MKFTSNIIESINEEYSVKSELNLKVDNSLKGTSIYMNNWEICTVDELSQMIKELTELRSTITHFTEVEF